LIPFDVYNLDLYCTLIFVFQHVYFLQQLDKETQQILKEEPKGCTILISVLNLSQRKCSDKQEYVGKHAEEASKKQNCNFTAIQLKEGTAYRLQRVRS